MVADSAAAPLPTEPCTDDLSLECVAWRARDTCPYEMCVHHTPHKPVKFTPPRPGQRAKPSELLRNLGTDMHGPLEVSHWGLAVFALVFFAVTVIAFAVLGQRR